ncbi:MAG: Hsp20 family protein [Alphaproteobacteria bacterium]
MRTFDLTPLYKTTVGFDRLASLMDATSIEAANGYPPYNIERLGENDYRITMAVSGFTEADLEIEAKAESLIVRGNAQSPEEKPEFLYQGIAARSFERRFRLAEYVEVHGAELKNGLLHIDLVRALPEAMKPRTIEIKSVKKINQKAA